MPRLRTGARPPAHARDPDVGHSDRESWKQGAPKAIAPLAGDGAHFEVVPGLVEL